MAGIRIDDLPTVTGIENGDNFVVTRNTQTYKTNGLNILQALSGVRNVENATANGSPVFKGSVNAAYGTTAQFNTLSAGRGLKLTTSGSVMGFSVEPQLILTDMIKDDAITTTKIASNSITVDKMNYSGCILQIQKFQQNVYMGSNVVMPNWTDTGISVTLNPVKSNSTFMIDVNVLLGTYGQFPYLNVFREVNGQNTNLVVSTSAGQVAPAWALGGYQADYSWQYTSQQTNFRVFDTPNTTSPVKYKLMISGSNGGAYWSYIGASWWWAAYVIGPRNDDLRHVPSTMTVFEIQT